MSSQVLSDLECATRDMSVLVMAALLGQIHSRLTQHEDLSAAAVHVREALALLLATQVAAFSGESDPLQ
ncbi:MAG: hypothetical protein NW217_02415 [Hyphomicrobiaceae bacterium]|nr:hypothetical protein [Hyphomicrobiaceae bacterium]